MKILLLKPARIRHEAGETVNASPAEADFLLSIGSAQRLEAAAGEAQAPAQQKKPAKKQTK